MRALVLILLFCSVALADDQPNRGIVALPAIIQQRDDALNGLAFCQGDSATKLAALQKELDATKKALEEAKKADGH